MKIGIFGGTFNPPHKGHVRLAHQFADTLQLDRLLIVPDKRPVHKICMDLALDEERVQMCRLAFHDPKFTVSTMEIDRASDSYTVYTVRELLKQEPEAELYLFMGSDMFLSFHKWYKYREILEHCTLCVASRADDVTLQTLRSYAFSQLKVYIPEREGRHILLSEMEPFVVSSSDLRARIERHEDLQAYLDDDVYAYIKEKKLYGYRTER